MIEAWFGADAFQAGLRAYLATHAHGSVTTADLIESLAPHSRAPGLQRALTSYLDQPGAPEVAATIECHAGAAPAVRLTQRPNGASALPGTRWLLPLCVVAGDGLVSERVCGALDGDELRLPLTRCPTWVWPNGGGHGYFESRVPDGTIDALMEDGWRHLDAMERAMAARELADLTRW